MYNQENNKFWNKIRISKRLLKKIIGITLLVMLYISLLIASYVNGQFIEAFLGISSVIILALGIYLAFG